MAYTEPLAADAEYLADKATIDGYNEPIAADFANQYPQRQIQKLRLQVAALKAQMVKMVDYTASLEALTP